MFLLLFCVNHFHAGKSWLLAKNLKSSDLYFINSGVFQTCPIKTGVLFKPILFFSAFINLALV